MSSKSGLKIDTKRCSIAGLAIGDSISKALAYIQMNYQIYGKIEIVSQKDDARKPTYIILPDSGFKLKFEAKYQTLEFIELFLSPQADQKKRLIFSLKEQPLVPQLMTYATVNNLMGPTFPPRIIGNSVLLSYADEGPISFVFMYSEKEFKDSSKELTQDQLLTKENCLVKINLQKDQEQFISSERKVKILLNEGIEIYSPQDNSKDPVLVLFGDHLMDVLRLLGNPNKEYYCEGSLFLNYLEFGFDIMISNEYIVRKIILHTNFPFHPHFGFHNRCFYELNLDQNQISKNINEEMKESFFSNYNNNQTHNQNYMNNNMDQSMISNRDNNHFSNNQTGKNQQQKKRKNKGQNKQDKANNSNNISMVSTKDSQIQQNIVKDAITSITPLTKFSTIREIFNEIYKEDQKQDQQFYVRNINNEFSTHYHAYRSIIFEVMVDCGDYIASVTLFKVQN